MSESLLVCKAEDGLIVRSRDPNIKQAFFSWGSYGTGLGNDRPEYYGRSVDLRDPPPGTTLYGKDAEKWLLDSPDDLCWEWRLTDESARHLVMRMRSNMGDDAGEVEASEHVIKALETALEER